MPLRGLGNRLERALNDDTRPPSSRSPVASGARYKEELSGAWPTAREILDPAALGDDLEGVRVFANAERNDTIPSPPPDFESAPWWDERGM